MGLPAFANVDELGDRISGGIGLSDETRAQAALDDASSIIRAEAGESWADGDDLALPDDPDWAAEAIKRICIAVARRAFENPDGATAHSESIDGYSHSDTFSESSNDIYLKASEKADIAKIVGGTSGVWTLATTRCDPVGATDLPVFDGDAYIEVNGSELLPFLPVDAGNGL